MASIYRLGENLLKTYNKRVQNGSITLQEAILAASQACNKYIKELIQARRAQDDYTVPYGCIFSYEVEVQKDESRGRWYAVLPIRTLESLYRNLGIFDVAPAENPDESMIPLETQFASLFKGRASAQLEGQLGFIPERDRVYIYGVEPEEGYKLLIKVIPDATGLAPDSPAPIPPDCEFDVIQMGLAILAPQIQTPEQPLTSKL